MGGPSQASLDPATFAPQEGMLRGSPNDFTSGCLAGSRRPPVPMQRLVSGEIFACDLQVEKLEDLIDDEGWPYEGF